MKKLTQEEVIQRLYVKYKDKFDFSNFKYENANTYSEVKCNTCGNIFNARARNLLFKNAHCHNCEKIDNEKKTTEQIIKELQDIYGTEIYDFSNSKYEGHNKPFTFKCNLCGNIVTTTAYRLIKRKNGCPKCHEHLYKRRTVEEVIETLKDTFNDEMYDYSLIKTYNNKNDKIPIVCHHKDEFGEEHGVFYTNTAKKTKCPKCVGGIKKSLDFYIKKAKKYHKDDNGNPLYEYSLITEENFINSKEKVPIICPIHGIFYQSFMGHIHGKNGCPICKYSKMEQAVQNYLLDNNIEFIPQCNYNTLPWLKCEEYNRRGLTLDFYLPTYQVAIECQGEQHFKARENSTVKMMSKETVEKIKYRDEVKFKLCKDNGVNLFYYSNLNLPYPHKIYNDLKLLFQDIENLHKNN